MRAFARSIELPRDVAVQCPHDVNARKHGRPAEGRDEKIFGTAVNWGVIKYHCG
jgi:hypothetical protein